tara:strand:- start:330 stop:1472 length:1143 start_codon:yes stop_codon:yes gene_type:complete
MKLAELARNIALLLFSLSVWTQPIIATQIDTTIPMRVGVMRDDAPTSFVASSGELSGIGIELFNRIYADLPVSREWVYYSDRRMALEDMKKNNIQLLIGSFEEDTSVHDHNISQSLPFFIDPIVIISKKVELSLRDILSLVFNRLFVTILITSFFLGIIITFILFFLEKDTHPHMKKESNTEKISYCFFTVFSCFFRDLLYDPVSSLGRFLLGTWILFSVFVIAVLSAIITSSILHLMDRGSEIIFHTNDLREKQVGILYGSSRLQKIMSQSDAKITLYNNTNDMMQALVNNEIVFAALGKTVLEKYTEVEFDFKRKIQTSSLELGYEAWVLFVNNDYGQIMFNEPLLSKINHTINDYRNNLTMHQICSHYVKQPEQCVF